jgi:sulfopyruvate decarboxylase subunit alpha
MNGDSTTRAKTVLAEMHTAGITDATGVPCSLLAGLFIELEGEQSPLSYHPAPREDTALGLASGLTLGGRRTVALMQNSGLGYCLNVITSFTLIYELHLPLIISWRGHDDNDAVEHDVIGRTLTRLLDLYGIDRVDFREDEPAASTRSWLERHDSGRRTAALVVRGGLSHA